MVSKPGPSKIGLSTSGCVNSPPQRINHDGWLEPARHLQSPNFNARPEQSAGVSLLVIHNISLPPGQFGGGYVEHFFLNTLDSSAHPYFKAIQSLQVSAHCFVSRDGRVTQFVSFAERAWHAGESSFQGQSNCNDYSIGIELEGLDDSPYTDQQYQALMVVSKLIIKHFPAITSDRIVGHSDIAPIRKTDPGPAFDWVRYHGLMEAGI